MIGHGKKGYALVYNSRYTTAECVGYYRPLRTGEPEGLIIFGCDAANNVIVVCNVNTLDDREALIEAFRVQRRASRHIASVLFQRPPQFKLARHVPPASALIRWMAKALIGGQK